MTRLSRRKSWLSQDNRRAVDCSADRPKEQREMRRMDNHSNEDELGEVIYSFPLSTSEFVKRATFYSSPPLLSVAARMSCLMGDTSSYCWPM